MQFWVAQTLNSLAFGGLLFLLTLRFQHPPIYDYWEPLDRSRRVWAIVAFAIFFLCFTPWPVTLR